MVARSIIRVTISTFIFIVLKSIRTTYSFLAAAIFLLLSHSFALGKGDGADDSICENYIAIRGSSNINHFQFTNYNPIIHLPGNEEKTDDEYRDIKVPVRDFTGPNHRMLNDFYDMIHASKYPFINIEIEPRRMADFDEGTGLTNFKTKISIAGKSKNYVVPCEVTSCKKAQMVLKGNFEVELSDFNIDPPEKMFGTIKVHNEVFINFVFKFMAGKTEKSKT